MTIEKQKKIVFMGTPDFAVMSLNAIIESGYNVAAVVTVPDRQSGRGLKVNHSPVKEYALEHGLPLLQPEKLRDPDFQNSLRALDADLFVVVAFRMLPESVWSMPPLGTFNLHASLLPQYRGAAPINWAIINGEKETGVTTFLLNEKIDEGKILLQQTMEITHDDTAESVHDRLAEMGAGMVVETIRGLFDGTISPKPQHEFSELKPAPKIFKQDCSIDWNKNGEEIYNFVRGLSPYPAATTTMRNEKGEEISMKIYSVEFEENNNKTAIGDIISDRKKELKIVVNGGNIKILSLQISGKKKISVEEFLRGYNISHWKLIN